jgi:hypothetical protein
MEIQHPINAIFACSYDRAHEIYHRNRLSACEPVYIPLSVYRFGDQNRLISFKLNFGIEFELDAQECLAFVPHEGQAEVEAFLVQINALADVQRNELVGMRFWDIGEMDKFTAEVGSVPLILD